MPRHPPNALTSRLKINTTNNSTANTRSRQRSNQPTCLHVTPTNRPGNNVLAMIVKNLSYLLQHDPGKEIAPPRHRFKTHSQCQRAGSAGWHSGRQKPSRNSFPHSGSLRDGDNCVAAILVQRDNKRRRSRLSTPNPQDSQGRLAVRACCEDSQGDGCRHRRLRPNQKPHRCEALPFAAQPLREFCYKPSPDGRSAERRVGKECVSKGRTGWS